MNMGGWVIVYELWDMRFGIWVMGYEIWDMGFFLFNFYFENYVQKLFQNCLAEYLA
jgi:hypothetical protein